VENPEEVFNTFRDESILNEERAKSIEGRLDYISDAIKKLEVAKKRITEAFKAEAMTLPEFRKEKTDIELSEEKLISERDALMMKHNVQHDVSAKIDLFKETCHKFLSKINDPKIVTERLKKDIIKLVIDEVVIEGESVKIFATIPLPNKIHEREMDPTSPRLRRAGKTDIPGPLRRSSSEASTFSTRGGSALGGNATNGATLGPVNETNMARIWNKHKQSNTPLKRKVFVGLSGGVDSSVSCALLLEQGYDVEAVFMKNWMPRSAAEGLLMCPLAADEKDARVVASQLGINFSTVSFEKDYRERVIDYLFAEYLAGRTPNPDILCNSQVKFKVFLEYALKRGADYVATGHYVRKFPNSKFQIQSKSKLQNQNFQLLKGKDNNKDQSYFLYQINQVQLKHCLFPIGEYEKPAVRKLAKKFGLATAQKPDSQGICFVGEVQIKEFLKTRIPSQTGEVVTTDGKIIGQHEGVWYYTIGQRRGLGVGGGLPYYVVNKDLANNHLIVARGDRDEALFKDELSVSGIHWVAGKEPEFPLQCKAKIRYRQAEQECSVNRYGLNGAGFRVIFKDKQRAVTPGQFIVFYQADVCLGGGTIMNF